jgi:ubiquinone/menaquinone biosynthesis C-methylase UbiE
MEKSIKKWWDKHSEYYQECSQITTDAAHYGPFSPNENKLNLLGKVRGKKILELGCGGGQCSIAFARKGAVCTAIDFSGSQLKFAGDLAKKIGVKINFIKADIQNFKFKKDEKFDIVFSSFALQFVSDLNVCFKNVNDVLKKGGLFIFSLDHPFYAIVSNEGKIESSYYQTGKYTDLTTDEVFGKKKELKKEKPEFIFYKRKISDIFNSLMNSGFYVEKIIEPNNYSKEDPWAKMYSLEVTSLIGPTIIFCARKVK